MFGQIAKSYDRTNSILSGGIHLLWKRQFVSRVNHYRPKGPVLDCATGSGDLAFLFAKSSKEAVIGTDFCMPMLSCAAERRKTSSAAEFGQADAMQLPFTDSSFSALTISFGIRNVADRSKAFSEFARVLKSGGTLGILEFGQPPNPLLAGLYNSYSEHVLPVIGGILSGKRDAYSYLNSSAAAFPCGDAFSEEILSTGQFELLEQSALTAGIAWRYIFRRR